MLYNDIQFYRCKKKFDYVHHHCNTENTRYTIRENLMIIRLARIISKDKLTNEQLARSVYKENYLLMNVFAWKLVKTAYEQNRWGKTSFRLKGFIIIFQAGMLYIRTTNLLVSGLPKSYGMRSTVKTCPEQHRKSCAVYFIFFQKLHTYSILQLKKDLKILLLSISEN